MRTTKNKGSCKVFISYATANGAIALKLFKDLTGAGAHVFHFEQSSKAGSDAWNQVLSAIKQADAFVILMSKDAMCSKAVRTELESAFYRNVNADSDKPLLIPLRLEQGVEIPDQLVTRTLVPFEDYETGRTVLIKTLGLSSSVSSEVPADKTAEPVREISGAVAGIYLRGKRLPDQAAEAYTRKRYAVSEDEFLKHLQKEEEKGVDLNSQATTWRRRNLLVFPAFSLLLGLAVSMLVYWLFGRLFSDLGVFITQLLPATIAASLGSIREWFDSTSLLGTSVSKAALIVGATAIVISTVFIADNEVPVDVEDYASISCRAYLVAGLVAFAWAFLCRPQGAGFALYAAWGVALSAATTAGYAVIDEL